MRVLVYSWIILLGLFSCQSALTDSWDIDAVYKEILQLSLDEFCDDGKAALSFELESFDYPKSKPLFSDLDFEQYYSDAKFLESSLDTLVINDKAIVWYAKDDVTNASGDFLFESIHWQNMKRLEDKYCKGLVISKPLLNEKNNTAIIRTRRCFEYQFDVRYYLVHLNDSGEGAIQRLAYKDQIIINY